MIGHGRLSPGEVVADRYQVESLLGVGGMGAVYRAVSRDGRTVALKVLEAVLSCTWRALREALEGQDE